MKAAAGLVAAAVLAGVLAGAFVFPRTAVRTRVVHVVDARAPIANSASAIEVKANLAGAPRSTPVSPLPGLDCVVYGSTVKVLAGDGPAWIAEICFRGLTS